MMPSNSIKLNSANFDYYILRVAPNTELEQIASKLATLREFDATGKYLVLECSAKPDMSQFIPYLKKIDDVAAKFALEVKFIVANQFILADQIDGRAVINLPATLQSKPILNQTLLIEEPVRSGIRIENDGDIIVTTLVSHNAEIIASGNIHVYGDCRGRVLAGNGGNKKAKIFIARFNAEMISIAGIYRVIEDKLPDNLHNKAVQIFLDEKERLNVIPLAV
ncbi:MAG: septum site-determining protein MinC [Neisseriales bacterium]|jgi:septum site-determining protein MinC|nr:MAG: septum site-determining protein MinC [Neisseriales bacterium]